MASRFLFNADLWNELATRLSKTRTARVAVAYLGAGASRLLPLRRGHQLVVDMSLRSVRAGTTDPREVRKLLQRGVEVFSRDSLHAKFFIFDRVLIAGSSNISKHARSVLDEAAVLTDDQAAITRASRTFEGLCGEPVRIEYLRRCLKAYRPPSFTGGVPTARRKRAVPQAKVWLLGGLEYQEVPEREKKARAGAVKRAQRKLADFERFEVEDLGGFRKPKRLFRALREQDWIIQCIRDGVGYDIYPPCRFLGVEKYRRSDRKPGYLLLVEQPIRAEPVSWRTVRAKLARRVPSLRRAKPRTLPIRDTEQADAVLRLWDAKGRFRKGRR
jgi:hypothetical protein